jgi:organic hydroperoxide reductase OsmC/OhrA
MSHDRHEFTAQVVWSGNTGDGTASYISYGRQYRVVVAGKPELTGSALPAFRGDPDRHNPEDLFLAAISACHMLTYLALCARRGVRVVEYADLAHAVMRTDAGGGGRFVEVTLCPTVTIQGEGGAALAAALHDAAHQHCFIANSCRVPIRLTASIQSRE